MVMPIVTIENISNSLVLKDNDDLLLVTPSKVKRRLHFFPSTKRKRAVVVDSLKTVALKKKIQVLQQGLRRKNKKIKNLNELLSSMCAKRLIDDQTEQSLSEQFEGTSKALFTNELINKGRKSTGNRHSNEVKEFAITLNYYLPKALKYCR